MNWLDFEVKRSKVTTRTNIVKNHLLSIFMTKAHSWTVRHLVGYFFRLRQSDQTYCTHTITMVFGSLSVVHMRTRTFSLQRTWLLERANAFGIQKHWQNRDAWSKHSQDSVYCVAGLHNTLLHVFMYYAVDAASCLHVVTRAHTEHNYCRFSHDWSTLCSHAAHSRIPPSHTGPRLVVTDACMLVYWSFLCLTHPVCSLSVPGDASVSLCRSLCHCVCMCVATALLPRVTSSCRVPW